MQKQSIDLHELYQYVLLEAHATWRYRWHALVLAWCLAIVGALLVFSLPNKYQASAQVYADTDALMNPLLRGLAVQPDVRGRLQIITHTLLARPNLETVADKTGLSLRATTPADKDELLEGLGVAVSIKDAGAANLYNISYTDVDKQMSQKVVQGFLQILMNDTLGANTASMQTAESFLQQQVADYSNRLNQEEKKIADFRKANAGFMPNQKGDDYFTRLQEAEDELQTLQGQYDAAAGGRAVFVAAADPRVQQLDKQIAAYQQQLDTLLLKYTDEYPDVVSARRSIAQLQAQRKALAGAHAGVPTTVATVKVPESARADGKKALAARIELKKQEIADLKSNVDRAADAQLTLQKLTRNYDITKKQYDELVSRLNTAQLSQDATQSGNNLKFRVISPPVVPLLPVSPKRGLLLLVAFVLAVAIGACFAYFLHKIKPAFLSLKSLREFSDFPVIGTFSLIVSSAHHQRRHREVIGFCAGVGLLAVVVILGFAFDGSLAHMVQHVFVMGAT